MRNIIFFVSFLISGMTVYAQLKFLPLKADYATFSGNNNKTYTEVYVALYQSDLAYQIEDTLRVAHFVHTLIISKDDSLIQNAERHYKNTEQVGESTQKFRQFMDVFAFEFDPGTYDLLVTVIDEVAQKKGEYTLTLNIPGYGSDFSMSDIELATKINKSTKVSNFCNKNNLEIFPNPSRTYGISMPILYFYFEVYNLKLNEDGNNRYSYHYYITDTDRRRVRDFPEKIKSSSSMTIAEAGGTNIITLSNNNYFLNVEIEDMLTREKTFARKNFLVDKPTRKSPNAQVQVRVGGYEEYLNFTREELIDEFNKSAYIAIVQEKDIFGELDEEGMRRFLAEFWKRRDPDPTTEVNEYKRIYFENLEYAEASFSNAFREGWKTDQGRILLIYGKPDEIERFPSSMDTSPYEIWQYYSLEGGSHFVFGDITGHGSFELLHSNYRHEIKDPTWRRRIGTGIGNFGAPNYDY